MEIRETEGKLELKVVDRGLNARVPYSVLSSSIASALTLKTIIYLLARTPPPDAKLIVVEEP